MKSISFAMAATVLLVAACEPKTPAQSPTPAATTLPTTTEAPGAATPTNPTAAPTRASEKANPATVTVKLEPKSGSQANGQLTLTETSSGVHVLLTVSGISPGAHGTHFHEIGDCSAPDASSAKGHYNPMHHDHGLPETNLRHLGDLGNIQVGPNGEGRLETDLKDASLDPASSSTLRGKSLILHEKTDDGSQPTGNSGPRIGCAVIP